MTTDGLYITHGPDRHALVIIRESEGKVLWIRDFVTVDAALGILEDDVLSLHDCAALRDVLSGKKGFFTKDVVTPQDGFKASAFRRYEFST